METRALPLRRQAEIRDEWLGKRLAKIVPQIMERTGIDCWVLIAREYNDDPVVSTMLPATWHSARRRTILVFTAFGAERVAISRYQVGDAFPAGWLPEKEPDQWKRLAAFLAEKNPQRIGINRSDLFALADGLSASQNAALMAALSPSLRSRVVAAHELAVGWLETRLPDEMEHYPRICADAHRLLRRALSPEVIAPGRTTTVDVEWWLRQESARCGYGSWFHPTVSVQRATADEGSASLASRPEVRIILPGDLVHIDFGIVHLGLHTDQQQHAYVLNENEAGVPAGLEAGLAAANRLQDILMAEFRVGRTGNEILHAARTVAANAGIRASIYSHPLGLHGHAAGPTIGLWDQQEGVPGAGDYPLRPNTAFSIELAVEVPVPEWNDKLVRIMLEEDGYFDGASIDFMDGRQTRLWLV